MIHKSVFEDTRLSWKAKGLMGYLLSRPDDWRIIVDDLVNRSKDGVDAVRSGLKELEALGYVETKRCTDTKGRVTHWEKIIYEQPKVQTTSPDMENPHLEVPQPENPNVGSPDSENPHLDNPTLLKTKTTKQQTKNKTLTNNKSVVAKGTLLSQLEILLKCNVHTLEKKITEWVTVYGEEYILDKARYISTTRSRWSNPLGSLSSAIQNNWDTSAQVKVQEVTQDERYRAFYNLFPDA